MHRAGFSVHVPRVSGLDVWYLLPIAADNAISLRALLWEVRYRTKAFNIC